MLGQCLLEQHIGHLLEQLAFLLLCNLAFSPLPDHDNDGEDAEILQAVEEREAKQTILSDHIFFILIESLRESEPDGEK